MPRLCSTHRVLFTCTRCFFTIGRVRDGSSGRGCAGFSDWALVSQGSRFCNSSPHYLHFLDETTTYRVSYKRFSFGTYGKNIKDLVRTAYGHRRNALCDEDLSRSDLALSLKFA